MKGWYRILFAGVGGQGVLSAARWVGDAAGRCDIAATIGQIHGLSQRGGSVQASVALGGARSPEIPRGRADILVAMEPMEGTRVLSRLSKRTTAFVNTRPLLPRSLQSARRPYPPLSSLLQPLEEATGTMVSIDATRLAEEAGSPRAMNVVTLGMLSGSALLPFPGEKLLETVLSTGIPDFAEVNRKAFRLGEEAARRTT